MDSRVKSATYSNRARGERLSSLFEYPAFFAAVFADPRFFSLLTKEQIIKAKEYLVKLWQTQQARRGVQEVHQEEDIPENDTDEDDEDDPFAAFLAKKNQERVTFQQPRGRASARRGRPPPAPLQGREKIKAMLEEYDTTTKPLPLKSDIFKFWEGKKLVWPELYELALIVLAIPATQVCVERLFSALRFILRPQRFNLSSERVDDIVFLHANPDLVREVAAEMLNESFLEPSSTHQEGP